eukprot:TRINITY_DN18469_c0_g1_i1.p1 TRINITY_DN18469_c0_g1~~TRINITY_DN18469_c0_g1_i1.p1  ORF type:complete len:125 (+),score=27.99 TRINITY_DN18469_c0_g1_i1:401-775(+)
METRSFARFLTVYTLEANPTDNWKHADGYQGTGARLPQAQSIEQLAEHASQFAAAHQWPAEIVLDDMDGSVGIAMATMRTGALWFGVIEGGSVTVPSKPPPFDYEIQPVREWLAANDPNHPNVE